MPCHETITCPKCGRLFECRVGTILQCQCQDVVLSEDETAYIRQQYNGCLCADCLRDMKATYMQANISS